VDLDHRMLYLQGEHTKTQKGRSLPLNQYAIEALQALRQFRDEHCPQSPWVFCRKNGNRLKDIKRSFQSALKDAGIKDFRPHDLRHDFASKLIRSGVPIYEVKELLGHQSMDMTQRYAHLDPNRLRSAVGAIK
jgi:site-specific recombinase XerD